MSSENKRPPRDVAVTRSLHQEAAERTKEYIEYYKVPADIRRSVENSYFDGFIQGRKTKGEAQ